MVVSVSKSEGVDRFAGIPTSVPFSLRAHVLSGILWFCVFGSTLETYDACETFRMLASILSQLALISQTLEMVLKRSTV